jgi:hypothetical protein
LPEASIKVQRVMHAKPVIVDALNLLQLIKLIRSLSKSTLSLKQHKA